MMRLGTCGWRGCEAPTNGAMWCASHLRLKLDTAARPRTCTEADCAAPLSIWETLCAEHRPAVAALTEAE